MGRRKTQMVSKDTIGDLQKEKSLAKQKHPCYAVRRGDNFFSLRRKGYTVFMHALQPGSCWCDIEAKLTNSGTTLQFLSCGGFFDKGKLREKQG